MPVIQFEASVVEDDTIRIPERYIDKVSDRVEVTLRNIEKPRLGRRETQRAAFEKFFAAMSEIDDEPLDEEFDAILNRRVNFTRKLDL